MDCVRPGREHPVRGVGREGRRDFQDGAL